jgi:hypothetical protein
MVRARLTPDDLRPEWRGEAPVLCVGGRDVLDEGAALMLGQLFDKHGLKTRVLGVKAITAERLASLDTNGAALVCLSFMDAPSTAHMRYAVRRVRRKAAGARVIIGLWRDRDPTTLEGLRRQTAADGFVTSFETALAAAIELACGPESEPEPQLAADVTENDRSDQPRRGAPAAPRARAAAAVASRP